MESIIPSMFSSQKMLLIINTKKYSNCSRQEAKERKNHFISHCSVFFQFFKFVVNITVITMTITIFWHKYNCKQNHSTPENIVLKCNS